MSQQSRISKNNTTITKGAEGCFSVTLHQTRIVDVTPSRITLDNGGWNTATTATRMNQTSREMGLGFGVSRKGSVMTASYKGQSYTVAPSVTFKR